MSKLFSLEKALAGEPIEFKGYKCYLHARRSRENAYIVESATSHTIWNPVYLEELNQNGMWEEPRPRVQLDLPCPVIKLEVGKRYYTINIHGVDCYDGDMSFTETDEWTYESIDDVQTKNRAEQGLLFASEADAQEWIDAMRNSRR
ncbi:hypothetical protein [Bibersteinia trehalosi]|uniref:hypothetical protein n=1 Tax=Bibersteinia trehalosi TaxID=47735 RepID=UPI002D793BE6|nr:hypothetical protein [Bibersteinia trehalosi]